MAALSCRTHPTPTVTLDPGHQTITLHAHPMHLQMDIPEAARGVNGVPAEVDRG